MPTMTLLSLVLDALLSKADRDIANQVGTFHWGEWEDKLKLFLILLDASHWGTVIGRTSLKCLSTKKWRSWYKEKHLLQAAHSLKNSSFCLCYFSSVMNQFCGGIELSCLIHRWLLLCELPKLCLSRIFDKDFCFFSPLPCSFKLFKTFGG